jgi:hypothetical protein
LAERERAEGMSGEDAAWRDLVARFDLPGGPDDAAPPWPAREDLPAARHQQTRRSADTGAGPGGAAETGAGKDAGASRGAEADASAEAGSGTGAGGRPGPDPGPADGPGGNGNQAAAGQQGPAEVAVPDRMRVIKPAVPVQLPAAEDEGDDDEHYIPPPPPPLPALDPVAKGAWTALFGGPAYLLVATSAGWVLPGWVTFGAVGAFVGGFAVLVIRMGDKPSRGSGPDNGAVL